MSIETLSPKQILRFSVWCIAISSIAALPFVLIRTPSFVHAAAGSIGIMVAPTGSAVATWFAMRARDRRLAAAAVVSALPLAFWSWRLYVLVYGNAP